MKPSFRYSKKVLIFYKHEKDKVEMKTLIPQLFLSMKQYTKEQFTKDVVSGIIVAIIALPLSIALALASGVTPEQGLYTAIIAGFVISFLGGSKVQIAGPTAAFATIVAGIVIKNGMEGLATATVLAGLILVIMGFLRLPVLRPGTGPPPWRRQCREGMRIYPRTHCSRDFPCIGSRQKHRSHSLWISRPKGS